ncbi:hypothetical protein BUALT_Bualt01G0006700 [Buddleja alternifolia]|uniref:Uncharacterized protein n=1 Tax=Buddleja alternifolia TaxID=168488 RepID=A0AAV6YBC8_9LAMI|nr:hypothetical protein BUALT_Bualt01G0006700 [Buddleja alternifolia]
MTLLFSLHCSQKAPKLTLELTPQPPTIRLSPCPIQPPHREDTTTTIIYPSAPHLIARLRAVNHQRHHHRQLKMQKSFTLLHTVATAGVFSAVSFWYGFMFGRESARKELGDLIETLRRSNSDPASSVPPPPLEHSS